MDVNRGRKRKRKRNVFVGMVSKRGEIRADIHNSTLKRGDAWMVVYSLSVIRLSCTPF